MNVLDLVTVAVTGFVACAEFGSYAFVHPVLRHLPRRERIVVEQGLLTTFGRVMPLGMILCVVLGISSAVADGSLLAWLTAASFVLAVTTTVIVNVPINIATGRWDPDDPPRDWERTRTRWERFQGIRSWLLLIGFALACATVTL